MRRTNAKTLLVPFLLLLLHNLSGAIAQSDSAITAAKEVFLKYVDLERGFDVGQGDLYAPDALIKNVRIYPGGENQTLTYSGTEYKRILRAMIPLAKAKNEVNQYSSITYTKEGTGVRIKCTKFSPAKQFASPFEMVVAPSGNVWQITAETTQSRP